jgi:hypothetical protein
MNLTATFIVKMRQPTDYRSYEYILRYTYYLYISGVLAKENLRLTILKIDLLNIIEKASKKEAFKFKVTGLDGRTISLPETDLRNHQRSENRP